MLILRFSLKQQSMWYHQLSRSPLPERLKLKPMCRFCGTPLQLDELETQKILRQLLELQEDIKLNPGSDVEEVIPHSTIGVCPACGWWKHEVEIRFSQYPANVNYHVHHGELQSLDLSDISLPLDQVRRYLLARFEARQTVNSRTMEDVVRTIFQDFGYEAVGCGYQNDGGLDIILTDSAQRTIGVQVKRYSNRINVEQIRAFMGALMLRGFTHGMYVTTSTYSKGVPRTVAIANERGLKIQLLDAKDLFGALKIANIRSYENSTLPKPWETQDFSIY